LLLAVSGDDNDLIESFVDSRFKNEGNVVDNNSVRDFSRSLPRHLGLKLGHAGMDDPLEETKFGSASEHDMTECLAIDCPIRIQHRLAERFHDGAPRWLPWSDNLPRKRIGVNHNRSASLEHVCDCGLTGRNSTSQSNKNHGSGA